MRYLVLLLILCGCSSQSLKLLTQPPPTPARTYAPPKFAQRTPNPMGRPRMPGELPPPPPPDPANTQAFVPPMMDVKGTPAALSAPDLQAQIERIYEDMDYAFLTRNARAMVDFNVENYKEDGKVENKAQQLAGWKKHFDEINALERELGTSLRLGSKNEIVKLTPKGPDRVAVQFRLTQRCFATMEGSSYQKVWMTEGRDLWVKQGETWKVAETTTGKEESHTYVDDVEVED